MIDIRFADNLPLDFVNIDPSTYKGMRIPGAAIRVSQQGNATFIINEYNHPAYHLVLADLQSDASVEIRLKLLSGFNRLELLLAGSCNIIFEGNELAIDPGNYIFTTEAETLYQLIPRERTVFFCVTLFPAFFNAAPIPDTFDTREVFMAETSMIDVVLQLLRNPYQHDLYPFYYANRLRDLILLHANHDAQPDQARDDFKFQHFLSQRMEHAKNELESTNKTMKEIATAAGFQTVPGFMQAFRQRYKESPVSFRNRIIGSRSTDTK